jgi:hypothetical protein
VSNQHSEEKNGLETLQKQREQQSMNAALLQHFQSAFMPQPSISPQQQQILDLLASNPAAMQLLLGQTHAEEKQKQQQQQQQILLQQQQQLLLQQQQQQQKQQQQRNASKPSIQAPNSAQDYMELLSQIYEDPNKMKAFQEAVHLVNNNTPVPKIQPNNAPPQLVAQVRPAQPILTQHQPTTQPQQQPPTTTTTPLHQSLPMLQALIQTGALSQQQIAQLASSLLKQPPTPQHTENATQNQQQQQPMMPRLNPPNVSDLFSVKPATVSLATPQPQPQQQNGSIAAIKAQASANLMSKLSTTVASTAHSTPTPTDAQQLEFFRSILMRPPDPGTPKK